jgi:hypothetical protein
VSSVHIRGVPNYCRFTLKFSHRICDNNVCEEYLIISSHGSEMWRNSFPDFMYIGRNTEVSIEMSDNVKLTENRFYQKLALTTARASS